MSERRSKKSESIEIRLTHDDKQAFMSKAAVEGCSASEIVRRSITNYLHDGRLDSRTLWKHAAAFAIAGIVVMFGHSISSPAIARDLAERQMESLRARLAFDRGSIAERRRLAKEYGKEFAEQRVLVAAPYRPEQRELTFRGLDLDTDGWLSLTEYRRLMGVPEGDPGRKLFQSLDGNGDGRLSKQEFQL